MPRRPKEIAVTIDIGDGDDRYAYRVIKNDDESDEDFLTRARFFLQVRIAKHKG